jgi:hypothetical protein
MSPNLSAWKSLIIDIGLFVIFLAGFGKFVFTEIVHYLR